MPFANNQGVRIYYETVGQGRPLVLHHGTSGSGPDWADLGYDALKSDHRLILVDARGHGLSDKPYDPAAYDLSLRASDVVSVLDDLDLPKADYFGYSMGGWIGFGLAKHAPARVNSFVIGAAHPYAESMKPRRDFFAPKNRDAFAAAVDQLFGARLTPAMRERFLQNDLEALHVLTQDRVSIAEVLPSMRMPCLLYVGELDPRLAEVKECTAALPDATLFTVPGCDHIATPTRLDVIVPQVQSFLSKRGAA